MRKVAQPGLVPLGLQINTERTLPEHTDEHLKFALYCNKY